LSEGRPTSKPFAGRLCGRIQKRAHILKLSPSEFPRLVENEQFFMQLAKAVGIEVAETASPSRSCTMRRRGQCTSASFRDRPRSAQAGAPRAPDRAALRGAPQNVSWLGGVAHPRCV
jgi:hypothetical protein